jgi:uncharacterized protein
MDVYSLNLTIFLIATFAGALVAGLSGFAFGLVAASIWLSILTPLQTATLIVAFGLIVQVTLSGSSGTRLNGRNSGLSYWALRSVRQSASPFSDGQTHTTPGQVSAYLSSFTVFMFSFVRKRRR